MVSRYREESAKSGFGPEALKRTLQTAGRTIIFSSLTIAAAVASLAVFPQRFLYSMGIAGAIVALLAAFLSLTVLPALLAVLGPRVNALAPKRLQRAAEDEARPAQHGFWYRLSRLVMRRPGRIAAAQRSVSDRARDPVLGDQVHPGGRQGAPRRGEREAGGSHAECGLPAQPDGAARGRDRRAGNRPASEGRWRRGSRTSAACPRSRRRSPRGPRTR